MSDERFVDPLMERSDVLYVLKRARQTVLERWTTGRMWDPVTDCFCLIGSLWNAAAPKGDTPYSLWLAALTRDDEAGPIVRKAIDELVASFNDETYARMALGSAIGALMFFNDKTGRDSVVALIDVTIARLEGGEV